MTAGQLCKEEERFLVEMEKAAAKQPMFDALALKQMGLTDEDVSLVQIFFSRARVNEFNALKATKSECVRSLIACLQYLPRTDSKGRITPESYKASDNIHRNSGQKDAEGKWSEKFRHEFGHALIHSHKERVKPALLAVLQKVFDWVEKFQKAHGIYEELPQWLRDGMAGDFKADSWIRSDMYEGEKKPRACEREAIGGGAETKPETSQGKVTADPITAPATEKQRQFLAQLSQRQGKQMSLAEVEAMSKVEASALITKMLDQEMKGGD